MNNCCTVSLVVVGMVDIFTLGSMVLSDNYLDSCKHLDLFWGGECNNILLLVIATVHYCNCSHLMVIFSTCITVSTPNMVAPSIKMVALLFMVAPLVMVLPPMITLNFSSKKGQFFYSLYFSY
jgi:hypothetical protein